MKKLLSLCLVALFSLSLMVGCGGGDAGKTEKTEKTEQKAEPKPAEGGAN
ncbi:MAG: hypothetical protein ACK4RK_20810 [Gemmataceae bacterium]